MREMSETDVEVIVGGNTAFAFDLYGKLREDEGNLFFSPHSISTALAMTYAGARRNTESQMAQTLHFSLDQKELHPTFASLDRRLETVLEQGQIQLAVANSLWPQIDYAFLEGFMSLVKENYGVLISPVNYAQTEAARKVINTWVEQKTEDKIKDLIPPGLIDELTTLVLVNAIYFKGNWARQFDPSLTKGATFWMTPAEGIEVPMMTQQQDFRYAESESVQVLELPYVGGDLSLVVLLPRKADGLEELENALTAENLEKWTSDLWEREVFVALPVFKMSGKFMLGGTLASMGMTDAFGSNADFSGMDGSKSLFISEVIHQAFIEMNEEGTEAAAATAVVMARSIPPPTPTFRADHPFVFLIRDNHSGSILFLGRVVNPKVGAD